jgi:hypothetical protein
MFKVSLAEFLLEFKTDPYRNQSKRKNHLFFKYQNSFNIVAQ